MKPLRNGFNRDRNWHLRWSHATLASSDSETQLIALRVESISTPFSIVAFGERFLIEIIQTYLMQLNKVEAFIIDEW